MTRINVGIDPSDLTREHLLAEHREIKRIPNAITSGKAIVSNASNSFKLGKGHVTFFYDKMQYLKNRYIKIRDECYRRGYNVSDYEKAWDNVPKQLMVDWIPSQSDVESVRKRIIERLNK